MKYDSDAGTIIIYFIFSLWNDSVFFLFFQFVHQKMLIQMLYGRFLLKLRSVSLIRHFITFDEYARCVLNGRTCIVSLSLPCRVFYGVVFPSLILFLHFFPFCIPYVLCPLSPKPSVTTTSSFPFAHCI